MQTVNSLNLWVSTSLMIYLYGYKCCSALFFLGINFSPVHILFALKTSFHVSMALAVAGKWLCLKSPVIFVLTEFLSLM